MFKILELSFNPHQSGFKKANSTETALIVVTKSLRARASSLSSVLILLNLSAAFDTVNHQMLLATLAKLCIAHSVLSWFISYLTNRTYQVTWNGSMSKLCVSTTLTLVSLKALHWAPFCSSVGSVITSQGFSYHCYTDDTQLFLSLNSSDNTLIATHISECLADISIWKTTHHLTLNFNKTELLLMPGKDLHGPTGHCRQHRCIPFSNCQKPWCGYWTISCAAPCGPILQICPLQHLQDPALPHEGSSWSKCWSSRALTTVTCLPPSVGQTTHPSSSAMLNYFSWTSGTAITKSKQKLIIKVTTLLEQAPCRCQDRRVAYQLPRNTKNSPDQRLCIATPSLLLVVWHLMYALIVCRI